MPDFAAISGRIARSVFARCGDAAEYVRGSDSVRTPTRGMVDRSYQTASYSGQRRLVIRLPIADIASAERGDRVEIEGGIFEVQQELDRDQIEIMLLVRDVTNPAARKDGAYTS